MNNDMDPVVVQDVVTLADLAGPPAPAERRLVVDEHIVLPTGVPARWMHGAPLRGVMSDCRGQDDTVVPGALRPGSLSLRDQRGPLVEGLDYVADEKWAVLTRTRELAPPVLVSYEYSLLRVDTLVMRDGTPTLVEGQSHLSNPVPARLAPGDEAIASVFVPYFSDGSYGTAPSSATLLPIRNTSNGPVSRAQIELLPAFVAARAAGRQVRVTCWGDSVTAGGSSSSPFTAFPQRLASILRAGGLSAEVSTVAVAGSSSNQWLGMAPPMPGTEWDRVAETRPDVVVLEFVNDAELMPSLWPGLYREILEKTTSIGADLLLLEPHFTRLDWMQMEHMDDPDPRPYVRFLRGFARSRQVPIASVSERWARLFSEGVAYPTLLRNGINHPDDRGHQIFAEEAAAVLGVPARQEGAEESSRLTGSSGSS